MSSFLTNEIGTIRKKWKGRLPIALIYPNTYPLAVSNLGFQLVYAFLNDYENILCERFVYPSSGNILRSLESNRPLTDFPIVMGSVSFENDYPNLISIFTAGSIAPLSSQRKSVIGPGTPLVILGGVAVFMNPEPLAPFSDIMIIGEAEPILPSLITYLSEMDTVVKHRFDILKEISSSFPGCYVPSLYSHLYDKNGKLEDIAPLPEVPKTVKKIIQPDMDRAGYSRLLSPKAELNMFMTELGRGCSQGCRFCAAGFIYRPPRLWHKEAILGALDQRPEDFKKIGLLGMEMMPEEALNDIADYIKQNSCALSFSSLRADRISPDILNLLSISRLKSATIAPDGCSERLRRVINKRLNEQDIIKAGANLVLSGINNLKLYIMLGLPTETYSDIDELINLVCSLKKEIITIGINRGRVAKIILSVNSFAPKPWTPFQFTSFAGLTADQAFACKDPSEAVLALKKKIKYLRKGLAGEANVRINSDRPINALQQAVFARGDRRLAPILLDMANRKLSFAKAMANHGASSWDYAIRPRAEEELFCWETIDHGINKKYLWLEYQKGLAEKTTSPCDTLRCKRCGVCNGNPSKR